MEVEGCVDVVTTLQRLREQRPGIFTSQVMKGRSRERGRRIERNEGKKERREGRRRSKKKKKMRKRKWEEGKG